jgi:hypothetical protein
MVEADRCCDSKRRLQSVECNPAGCDGAAGPLDGCFGRNNFAPQSFEAFTQPAFVVRIVRDDS